MIRSVRHSRIRRLQRVGNHLSQQPVQALRGNEVHSQPHNRLDLRWVVRILNYSAKSQSHGAVVLARLGQNVAVDGDGVVLSQHGPLIAEGNALQFGLGHRSYVSAGLNARQLGPVGLRGSVAA